MSQLNPDLPVWVYRNLRTGNFSCMQRGKVVDHRDSILLEDCRFVVRPAGYARFLRERRKNVHAFVVGKLTTRLTTANGFAIQTLSYNPSRAGHFSAADGRPVTTAHMVSVNKTGIHAIGAN